MRQIQKTVKLIIPVGQNTITETFVMPKGFVKSMALYSNDYTKYGAFETYELSLNDDSSVEIIPLTHIDHFKRTNGDYENSFKPLNFDSEGKTFALTLKASSNLNAYYLAPTFYIVFLMDTQVR